LLAVAQTIYIYSPSHASSGTEVGSLALIPNGTHLSVTASGGEEFIVTTAMGVYSVERHATLKDRT
jgi:hypothetical protein